MCGSFCQKSAGRRSGGKPAKVGSDSGYPREHYLRIWDALKVRYTQARRAAFGSVASSGNLQSDNRMSLISVEANFYISKKFGKKK